MSTDGRRRCTGGGGSSSLAGSPWSITRSSTISPSLTDTCESGMLGVYVLLLSSLAGLTCNFGHGLGGSPSASGSSDSRARTPSSVAASSSAARAASRSDCRRERSARDVSVASRVADDCEDAEVKEVSRSRGEEGGEDGYDRLGRVLGDERSVRERERRVGGAGVYSYSFSKWAGPVWLRRLGSYARGSRCKAARETQTGQRGAGAARRRRERGSVHEASPARRDATLSFILPPAPPSSF